MSSQTNQSVEGGSEYLPQCTVCTRHLSSTRLAAMPTATMCVTCLTNKGDVDRLKRFDQYTEDGGLVTILFTRNPMIERAMWRLNNVPAPNINYEQAVSDDSFMKRSPSGIIGGYGLPAVFEGEEVVQ